MEGLNAEEKSTPRRKEVKIFGRNVADIPCFRDSFICGICSGVAGGLLTFMFTSKARLSSHIAFTSLWLGVFVYWIPCRYKFESNMLMAEHWRKAHKHNLVSRGEEEQDSENVSPEPSQEDK